METTEVIIVGAGPTGLALGICLSKLGVKSIILEKELQITEDPRGVALTNDAVRICWDLGLGRDMDKIGHELPNFNFHKTSFADPPFFILDSYPDVCKQTVPNAIWQIQPLLELAMQEQVNNSQFCNLRRGCTVTGRKQKDNYVIIEYTNAQGKPKSISGSWLIGADGKRGIVRKHFLESSAGIRQIESTYKYDGTWVAANLKMTLPTPESHPQFPLWELGYTPDEVYDLFWPVGWRFGSPPGKPFAAGRFGPHESRFWRHEFAQDNWSDAMDAEELLWDHLTPMITRKCDGNGRAFPSGAVMYPRDCIEVRRCRPFRFTHKVVNKWFDDRTVLIGDAAHVFPPFGGQGIASGLRDAQQLSWRLHLLQRLPNPNRSEILQAWAKERTKSIKQAANLTKLNGQLCNDGDSWPFWLLRNIKRVTKQIPFLPDLPDPFAKMETRGFTSVEGGFFAPEFEGGGRLPQVYLSSQRVGPTLSDCVLSPKDTAMVLIVLTGDNPPSDAAEAKSALDQVNIEQAILNPNSIRLICRTPPAKPPKDLKVYYPTPVKDLSNALIPLPPLYSPANLFSRFTPSTKFVLLRADFFVFGLAKDYSQLVECIACLNRLVQN